MIAPIVQKAGQVRQEIDSLLIKVEELAQHVEQLETTLNVILSPKTSIAPSKDDSHVVGHINKVEVAQRMLEATCSIDTTIKQIQSIIDRCQL